MILITGAYGFVGSALLARLQADGVAARGAVRNVRGERAAQSAYIAVGDFGPDTDWAPALAGCTAVVHLAARVHVMNDTAADALQAYRRANVDATIRLARQASEAGVRRFVYVSSVKVNGEATTDTPYTAFDVPAPCDPYGLSKLEAERALQQFAAGCEMELVIVRPPLVYGPGVKANFAALIGLVERGLPLPLGKVANRRSMVGLRNLVDLLLTCCSHPRAPGQVFMVSDGNDLGIAELVTAIARSMGKRPRLMPVPVGLLRALGRVTGKQATIDRLLGSLQVDIGHTQTTLEWQPKIAPTVEIDQTVEKYLAEKRNKK